MSSVGSSAPSQKTGDLGTLEYESLYPVLGLPRECKAHFLKKQCGTLINCVLVEHSLSASGKSIS